MSDEGICVDLVGSNSAAFAMTELRHWHCTGILTRERDVQKRSPLLAKPLVPPPTISAVCFIFKPLTDYL